MSAAARHITQAFGWLNVALHALFTIAYGCVLRLARHSMPRSRSRTYGFLQRMLPGAVMGYAAPCSFGWSAQGLKYCSWQADTQMPELMCMVSCNRPVVSQWEHTEHLLNTSERGEQAAEPKGPVNYKKM